MRRVEDLARHPLLWGTTPLMPAPRLSEHAGIEVWFKRDDLTGRGLGGNKVRTLEYLVGDALASDSDCLVTGAGPQSNWAMLASLCARQAGMVPHVVFYGDEPPRPSGNLLLAHLARPTIQYTGDGDRTSVDAGLARVAEALIEQGHRPYVIPRGGATPLGCLGYVQAAAEIRAQLPPTLSPTALWLPTGSCGTQAGLVAGKDIIGWNVDVVGVAVSRTAEESRRRVRELAAETLNVLQADRSAYLSVRVIGGYLGPGYGRPSAEGTAAAHLVAATEGVFLDPVFGAKAMAALLAEAREGSVRGPVVFLVTGGAPTLFAGGSSL